MSNVCNSSSDLSQIDLQQVCRTCLKVNQPDSSLFSIFSTHPASQEPIGSLLIDCTGIDFEMDKSHLISTNICSDCHWTLGGWYEFREAAKAANKSILDELAKRNREVQKIQQTLHTTSKLKIEQAKVESAPLEVTEIEVNEETIEIKDDTDYDNDDFAWPEKKKVEKIPKLVAFFHCCQCAHSFYTRREMHQHAKSKHAKAIQQIRDQVSNDRPHRFVCEICSSAFATNKELMKHQRMTKLCTICGKLVSNQGQAFADHRRMHRSNTANKQTPKEKRATCCMCTASYDTRPELIRHAESEHSILINKRTVLSNASRWPFECDICTIKCQTKKLLYTHQNRYKRVEMCTDCGEIVPMFLRKNHMQKHSDAPREREHFCDICKRHFSSLSSIRYHMELHSSEIRLACPRDDCRAMLRSTVKLNEHLRMHVFKDAGRTLKCPEPGCKRMFYAHLPKTLRKHQRIHTGRMYFSCELCPKTFVDQTDYKRHQWQHAGVSPYMCQYCNKMLTRKKLLLEHEDTCVKDHQISTTVGLEIEFEDLN